MAKKPKDKATPEQEHKAVYFAELYLENVKCFKKPVKLDLSDGNGKPAKWTVILGDNGAGKTTLLQGLALLKPEISRRGFDSSFSDDFDKSVLQQPALSMSLFKYEPFTKSENDELILAVNLFSGKNLSDASIVEEEEMEENSDNSLWTKPLGKYLMFISGSYLYYMIQGTESLSADISPFIGYGIKRNQADTLIGQERMGNPNDILGLFESNALTNPDEWLLTLELQIKNSQGTIKNVLERKRLSVEEILITILPDVYSIRPKTILTEKDKPGIEVQTPYGWIDIKHLSHGYQTVTAWIVDLAARMFYHYPDSPNPLAEPAVVLVDEIDLHLHPKWQRTIMQDLSRHFPNVQFIVTAHSPLIVQSAPEGTNVVVLKRVDDHVEIINDPVSVRGWRVDQILASELFDEISTRGPEYDDILKRRNQLAHKSKLTKKEEAELKEISSKLEEELPFDLDPQISLLLDKAAKYQKDKK